MGSRKQKEQSTNAKKLSKEPKIDNFCYFEVGRAMTKLGVKVKSNIIVQNCKKTNLIVNQTLSPLFRAPIIFLSTVDGEQEGTKKNLCVI